MIEKDKQAGLNKRFSEWQKRRDFHSLKCINGVGIKKKSRIKMQKGIKAHQQNTEK